MKNWGYIVAKEPKATYAAMISHLDRDVGRIVELLRELGLEENTIVIFTSDNGAQSGHDVNEEFFEAGGPLRGYKGSMYEGGLRVPMIVRWPGKVAAGSVSGHVTYFPDVMPTLAELAGAEAPAETDGISIVPTILGAEAAGRSQSNHEWLYWELVDRESNATKRAARRVDWKFAQNDMEEPVELYNLADDIGEARNLAPENPDLIAEFEEYYRANRTPARTFQEIPPVSVDDYVR